MPDDVDSAPPPSLNPLTPDGLQQSAASANVESFPNRCGSYGGGRQHLFPFEEVGAYIVGDHDADHDSAFKFIDHVDSTGPVAYSTGQNYVVAVQPHHSERSTNVLRYTSLVTLPNHPFGFLSILSEHRQQQQQQLQHLF